ncbi:hypothetical protein K469DRAFT_555327 [Zopfia rhizophila CBS 207.26]|uniref:DUF3176 domain containing protein n=1 Tax=Zopfia rhizophila CBS 207.26 TaxID=1314779 RepID=A0A6A6EPD2_9PEZI|nr:hypothetical protein K469DRAFT_555327 [Zopfia rhizophila CBS 207.26]
MSSQLQTSPWPKYPSIPIFLDTRGDRLIPVSYGTGGHTLNTPNPNTASPNTPSRQQSVHYYALSSPHEPRNQFLNVPNPATSNLYTSPQSYRNDSYYLAKTYQPQAQRDSEARAGLGILNATSNPPHISHSPNNEKNRASANIAQRIEKRLWEYNSSKNVVARWLLEIISWLISAICMGAIVGVLLFLKDKRLPTWPLGLTLNAYIAILSRIASAALVLPVSEALGQLKWSWFKGDSKKMWDFEIFDNASRGPWGAFLLLIRTKCRTLAALGAAVTILLLDLDPFFQQVVDYPSLRTLQGDSSIPKVTRYEPHFGIKFQNGQRLVQPDQTFQQVVEKFFYENGTQPMQLGVGERPDIPLSCPTSNCTWPIYETLGICSACSDVSQLLTPACLTTTVDWFANLTNNGSDTILPNRTVCGHFLNATSDTPTLMSGYSIDPVDNSMGEALVMRAMSLVTRQTRRALYGGSINFRHIRNPIIDFVLVGAANGSASVYRNETPSAHECALSWCVKTMNSSYFWAKYVEEEKEVFWNTTAGPYPWQIEEFEDEGKLVQVATYTENITVNPSFTRGNTSNYGVSNVTALQTILIFDDMFPSYATVANPSAVPFLRSKVYMKGAPALVSFEGNPWIAPNNITRHVERLVTALTNVIRYSSSNEMVIGKAFDTETYVSVRWAWLSLPISLLFFSLIFLVGTVVKSSEEKEQVGIWKTSAVATLLYGLPDNMQRKITGSTSVGTPRAKAKTLRIKLLPKKGWRASGNLFSPMTPKVRQYQPPPGWI